MRRTQVGALLLLLFSVAGCSDDAEPSDVGGPSGAATSTSTDPEGEASEASARELLTIAEWQLLGDVHSPRLRFRKDGTVDGGIFCRDVIFGRYEVSSPTSYEFTPSASPPPESDCLRAARLRSVLSETTRIRLLPRCGLELTDGDGRLVGRLIQPYLDS